MHVVHFAEEMRILYVIFLICRSELSVEKTSVLQSELQSCNQLQELEPLNKCKYATAVISF